MKRLTRLFRGAQQSAEKVEESARKVSADFKSYIQKNSPIWGEHAEESVEQAKDLAGKAKEAIEAIKERLHQ